MGGILGGYLGVNLIKLPAWKPSINAFIADCHASVLSPRSIIRSKSLDSLCRSDRRTPPLISRAIIGSSEPLILASSPSLQCPQSSS
ncbi:hypothetical protein PCASD_17819 [Puccinia coronata f. sp. avenae]|uniref:Uncharacterized protein n=1 Tax=Puccinia coronata f. sp. avenae TaxID=200324 RepID=A0A2N5U3D1_9BASI|nr:hypothetical protein PCASD_17819 [Puccinia coronata f. sp. avenae]